MVSRIIQTVYFVMFYVLESNIISLTVEQTGIKLCFVKLHVISIAMVSERELKT